MAKAIKKRHKPCSEEERKKYEALQTPLMEALRDPEKNRILKSIVEGFRQKVPAQNISSVKSHKTRNVFEYWCYIFDAKSAPETLPPKYAYKENPKRYLNPMFWIGYFKYKWICNKFRNQGDLYDHFYNKK